MPHISWKFQKWGCLNQKIPPSRTKIPKIVSPEKTTIFNHYVLVICPATFSVDQTVNFLRKKVPFNIHHKVFISIYWKTFIDFSLENGLILIDSDKRRSNFPLRSQLASTFDPIYSETQVYFILLTNFARIPIFLYFLAFSVQKLGFFEKIADFVE